MDLRHVPAGGYPLDMRHQRLFFIVVIGALLAVLAIFAVIALVLGDDGDQGGNVDPQPSPESAPLVVRPAG